MPDRRIVDDLSIEELEQVLIVKRRETRAERMRRLQEIGRLPAEAAIPHEDLASVGAVSMAGGQTGDLTRQRPFGIEPVGGKKRTKTPRQRAPRTRWGRPQHTVPAE